MICTSLDVEELGLVVSHGAGRLEDLLAAQVEDLSLGL